MPQKTWVKIVHFIAQAETYSAFLVPTICPSLP